MIHTNRDWPADVCALNFVLNFVFVKKHPKLNDHCILQVPPKPVETSGPPTPEEEEEEAPPPPIATRPDKTKSIAST